MIQPELLLHFILEGLWLVRVGFFFISTLFQQSTYNPHLPQSWSDRDRHPRVAKLDGVPQSGQDDQLLHPHHASAHLLYAGAGAVLSLFLNNQKKLC